MRKLGLHPNWYLRLLLFWLFTGLPLLVLANFHSPTWFSILPGAPPLAEGLYATLSWVLMALIIWHPVLLLPFAVWSRARRHSSEIENA